MTRNQVQLHYPSATRRTERGGGVTVNEGPGLIGCDACEICGSGDVCGRAVEPGASAAISPENI